MKSVLISIQPKWVEKIASGEKTIEVRKTKPKIETPFKCHIYETKAYDTIFGKGKPKKLCVGGGRVIGEFVCDKIDEYFYDQAFDESMGCFINKYGYEITSYELSQTCLSYKEFENYGNTNALYGWHISNLVIYDKPKELSEFGQKCDMAYEIRCRDCLIRKGWNECCEVMCKPLTRPPQSWCYVESLGE